VKVQETLIHSGSQAGFVVLDAMQGANHSNAPKSTNGSGARN